MPKFQTLREKRCLKDSPQTWRKSWLSWENSDYYCREKPADRRRLRLVDRREDLIPIGTPPETVTRFFTFQHRLKTTHIMYLNDDGCLLDFFFRLPDGSSERRKSRLEMCSFQ